MEFYIYLLILAICTYIVERNFRINNFYNPFVLFFVSHVFTLYIALLWADSFKSSKGVSISDNTKFFICYSLLVSVISATVFNFFFTNNTNNTNFNKWFLLPPTAKEIRIAYVLYILGISLWLFFILSVGTIPILHADIDNFRIKARESMGYVTLGSICLLTYNGVLLSLHYKGFVKIIFILISSLFLLSFGNREPFLSFLIFCLILHIIKNKIKFRLGAITIIGSIAYVILVVLGAHRMNADADFKTKFLLTIGWRPFVNIQNLDIILSKFNSYLYGLGYWIDLYVLAPGYSPNLGTWLKGILKLDFDGGSVTITHLGESYINFGYAGIYIYPTIISFSLIKTHYSFKKKYLSYFPFVHTKKAVIYLLLSYSLSGLVSSGVTSVMLYKFIPFYIIYRIHLILSNADSKLQ
ncbi:O-antigen polymerase [Spirosoma sp. SC4-14]|uniref:O-antigen polymerase n=1 Tax=Spirosoma sp. SC4-14 TaxID=3128900 RepID=UPI0030D45395